MKKKYNHTQMIYGLKVHTLNTDQTGAMDRYLMAFILCYLFGYDYDSMKADNTGYVACKRVGRFKRSLPSHKFIEKVVLRIRGDRGISEIWLYDLGLRYDNENWWEGRYTMLKCA